MIILDTNVLSELMRREPSEAVVGWIDRQPMSGLFTTTVTQAEILYGISLLPRGKRREAIHLAALKMFEEDFAQRVLAFGPDAARAYAEVAAARRRAGRPISAFDAQIAAIARVTGAVLATRNTSDFELCGVEVVDPWAAK